MKNDRLIAGFDANRGYSGIPTFLRSKICKNLDAINASYAVLCVPNDEGSHFVGGSRLCTGSMIINTAEDLTPYFLIISEPSIISATGLPSTVLISTRELPYK